MAFKILVVDDHSLVRQGIIRLLKTDKDIEVVGEGDNGYNALEKAEQLKPDVILMDLYMPGLDGIAATRLIKKNMPDVCVIILTVSEEEEDIMEAVYAGAQGYILKNTDPSSFVQQVKGAFTGEVALGSDMVKRLITAMRHKSKTPSNQKADQHNTLSDREKEVLALISKGLTNKEIAPSLYISINTTRTHIRALMQKLNLDNRTQLATYAMREGLTGATTSEKKMARSG